jgi:flagellar biosynthesis anti-sigma factor FlgM
MRMKLHERASGMIEGVGRMQPVTPALGEASSSPAAGAPREAGGKPALAAPMADMSLARLAAEMAAAPPVDAAKVAMLRDEIAGGSYRPDPMAIAGAMMAQSAGGA